MLHHNMGPWFSYYSYKSQLKYSEIGSQFRKAFYSLFANSKCLAGFDSVILIRYTGCKTNLKIQMVFGY